LGLKIDLNSLLLEAGRRMPANLGTRFRNPAEVITLSDDALTQNNLLPAEVFLLSRLEKPATVRELAAISGVGEEETLTLLYPLALAGLVQREHWNSAFRDQRPSPAPPRVEVTPVVPPRPEREEAQETDEQAVESFLERVKNAPTHYEVLDVGSEVSASELKRVYYQLARRYHPDRFRTAESALVKRLESAFARIRQAYDTLKDDKLRSSYNLKLEARRKVEKLTEAAPKAEAPAATSEPATEGVAEPVVNALERAENQFKEGLAALELGQPKVALGLFASAARAVPKEPRYRAFYGQMLAANEQTRRAAEAELLAAIKLDPGKAEYRMILAELYRDLGLKLRAKGEAERAVTADPNNRKARDLLRSLT
jgi:curved DNA-binding protein CbpA